MKMLTFVNNGKLVSQVFEVMDSSTQKCMKIMVV